MKCKDKSSDKVEKFIINIQRKIEIIEDNKNYFDILDIKYYLNKLKKKYTKRKKAKTSITNSEKAETDAIIEYLKSSLLKLI